MKKFDEIDGETAEIIDENLPLSADILVQIIIEKHSKPQAKDSQSNPLKTSYPKFLEDL